MSTVYCNSLNNINWEGVSPNSFELENTIHVWRVRISAHFHLLQRCTSVLHPEETVRAQSYHHEKDRNRFILSRGILRFLLGKYSGQPPQDVRIEMGPNKKPFIPHSGTIDLHYNVAHSQDWILIAIANSMVGIDVEYINADFEFSEILPTCFSGQEISFIQKAQPHLPCFYTLWTRKEALVKATSKGIDNDLPIIPCLDGKHTVESSNIGSGDDWVVSSFEMETNYMGSISYGSQLSGVSFRDAKYFVAELS